MALAPYVRLNDQMVHLRRAVDHEGAILESYATQSRDKKAALSCRTKALWRRGTPEAHRAETRSRWADGAAVSDQAGTS